MNCRSGENGNFQWRIYRLSKNENPLVFVQYRLIPNNINTPINFHNLLNNNSNNGNNNNNNNNRNNNNNNILPNVNFNNLNNNLPQVLSNNFNLNSQNLNYNTQVIFLFNFIKR